MDFDYIWYSWSTTKMFIIDFKFVSVQYKCYAEFEVLKAVVMKQSFACCLIDAGVFPDSILKPGDGGDILLRKVC
jgi:hypothetical protein